MIKRKLQVILVENGTSIKIGEGELGVRVDSEERFGTVVRLIKGRIGEPNSGFFNLDLDLSEKTIMAFRNAIEEAPEDPLGHLLAASPSARTTDVQATECVPCKCYWYPPVHGPRLGDPCPHCGRATTQYVSKENKQPVTIMALTDQGWLCGSPSMLIEISPSILGFNSFKRRMFNSKVFNGLFITPSRTQVIRDPATSKEYAPSTFLMNTIDTVKLLEGISGWNLESRVRIWLNRISSGSWIDHIPKEAYPFMIPYVVGSLADAVFEDWDARE